jgi:hypothetical protein
MKSWLYEAHAKEMLLAYFGAGLRNGGCKL